MKNEYRDLIKAIDNLNKDGGTPRHWKMLNYIVLGINWSATTYGAIKGVSELCKKELEIYSTKNINNK